MRHDELPRSPLLQTHRNANKMYLKFSPSKSHSFGSAVLIALPHSCDNYHRKDTEHFHHSQNLTCAIPLESNTSPLQPLASTDLSLFVFSKMLHKQNQTTDKLLRLACFTRHNVFETIHAMVSINTPPFLTAEKYSVSHEPPFLYPSSH